MTISVQTSDATRWMVERWVPEADTGAEFTPGHWEQVEEGETTAGGTFSRALAAGEAVKFWRDAEDDQAAPAAA